MNEPLSGNVPTDPDFESDTPTPEQAATLQYLGFTSAEGMTRARADALIHRSESDPAAREKLRAWERDKHRLHPDLFAPPQRSYREARWWQALISDETLHGYSFQQPSLDQTFVILDTLDRREPGWDREGKQRREARFMNELATLSPELCKPGCIFPHDLPAEDSPQETPAAPPTTMRAPSAPFVPDKYAASAPSFTPPSRPAWQPPVQLPSPTPLLQPKTGNIWSKIGGLWKWLCLVAVLAAGVGAYFWFDFHTPTLERGGGAKPSANALAPIAANASRRRALAKYPDLARDGSPLNVRFLAAFHRLESEHSPLLQQPDWPERLAAECAASLSSPPISSAPNVKR